MIINENHKNIIEETDNGEWEYIGTYEVNELMKNGKYRKPRQPKCLVKHKYCEIESVIRPSDFKMTNIRPQCCCYEYKNSFASFVEKELDLNIDKIWDFEKNEVNPYHIYRNSRLKVWLKCANTNYHPSNLYVCDQFVRMIETRKSNKYPCPYCSHKGKNKIHPKDSFAQWGIDTFGEDFLEKYWSNKNTLDPYEIYKGSEIKIWIKCLECNDSYYIRCANFTYGYRCNICNKSKGELVIREFLYNNSIEFIPQKTFNDLVGLGNGYLSYDFYLPKYNLLIEYQGIQHKEKMEYFGGNEGFAIQQEHDKRKKEYAEKNNIQLLEIWYWDFDNIDKILINII